MEGRDGVGALSLPQGWSQLPPEILGIIFSSLERKCDLLNGRLVCRSWNQECRKVLQKPDPELKFYQTLTEQNIREYVNIISKGDIPQLTLPFHISVNIRAFRAVKTADPYSDPDPASVELYQINLNSLIENVESLCTVFGEECIQKVTLKTVSKVYSENNKIVVKRWLIEFLKASRGLKILDLRDFSWALGRYTEDEVSDWKLNELNFPALNTFICYGDYLNGIIETVPTILTTHVTHPVYKYIVQNSPHLENLEGIRCQELIKLPLQFTQLKSLFVEDVNTNLIEILEKFRQSSNLPVLQELRFTSSWTLTEYEIGILHNILECVSINLKSLTIITVPYDSLYVPRLMNFPELPVLQHLHLKLEVDFGDLLFLDSNITPENLPVLKSVELPLGLIFGDNFCSQEEVPVKFTSVNDLTIHVNHATWIIATAPGLYQGLSVMKHLLKVFPNAAKLTIKNECLRENQQKGVRDLIQSLIQSPLSKNIQHICIEGFEADFLGPVLRAMDNIPRGQGQGTHTGRDGSNNSFFMKDVRKVRLGLSVVTHTKCGSSIEPTIPNLMAIAKYFPALQTIEISELLFRGMFDEDRKELFQKLTTAFPYLWVNVY